MSSNKDFEQLSRNLEAIDYGKSLDNNDPFRRSPSNDFYNRGEGAGSPDSPTKKFKKVRTVADQMELIDEEMKKRAKMKR